MRQLAKKLEMSASYLSEIETGQKKVNNERLDAIAAALGVDVSQLWDSDELLDEFKALPPDLRREAIDYAKFRAMETARNDPNDRTPEE